MSEIQLLEHSNVMGGSTAAQRINCPGSYQLEKNMPKEGASEFAERGSMLHACMELIITEDPATMEDAEPLFTELLGQDLGFGEDHQVTEELVNTKLRPAMQAWFDVREEWGIDDWFIEQRVSLEQVIPGAFGTADIVGKDKQERLHILDWKFGDGVPVPVEANYGLGFYAAASLYDDDPELNEFCEGITGVVLHIVQPRVGANTVLDSWETTEDWVEQLVDAAAEAMRKADSDNPPVKAGPWCRWCSAKPICPAHDEMASEALGSDPETMSGVELAAAMDKAQLLTKWIGDVVKLAQRELEGGAAIPGYKLVHKKPRRQWKDEEAAEQAMRAAKMKVGDMLKKTLISPTQLDDNYPKVYSKLESEHVIMHSSGLTVVPDSDSRPAVSSSMGLLANALDTGNSES